MYDSLALHLLMSLGPNAAAYSITNRDKARKNIAENRLSTVRLMDRFARLDLSWREDLKRLKQYRSLRPSEIVDCLTKNVNVVSYFSFF
jgi:hypothetical protein